MIIGIGTDPFYIATTLNINSSHPSTVSAQDPLECRSINARNPSLGQS